MLHRFPPIPILLLGMLAWTTSIPSALAQVRGDDRTILYAPSAVDDASYRAAIAAAASATVDHFDASEGTPTLATLENYDCVYTWTFEELASPVIFGDRLASYVDGGGVVVLGFGSASAAVGTPSGEIHAAGYSPVTSTALVFLGEDDDAGDGLAFLHVGVEAYSAPNREALVLQGAGIADGTYVAGEIAQAFRPDGRVVYTNGGGGASMGGTGDWPRIIANACFGASLEIDVTKLTDTNDGRCDGDCSLREAVLLSNASPYPDTIRLGAGTHVIATPGDFEDLAETGDFDIHGDLVIEGSQGMRGTDPATVIDANRWDRIFHVDPLRLGVDSVTLRDLTLTDGFADFGGAVEAWAPTTLERVVLADSFASSSGGGLSSASTAGVITLIDSTIRGNSAKGGGGGIEIEGPGSTILRSTISGNTETGDFSPDPDRSDTAREHRGATGGGGGIRLVSSGSVTIRNSTLSGNASLGGRGDAIHRAGSGSATLEFSTVARPRAAPHLLFGEGFTLSDSIVDGACEQAATPLGGNVEAPGDSCGFGDPPRGATAPRMRLAPLAMNGGSTATHGLAEGSPAIDGARFDDCPVEDQRGVLRPLAGDDVPPASCDVGALEYDPDNDDFTTIFTGDFDSGDTGAWGNTVP